MSEKKYEIDIDKIKSLQRKAKLNDQQLYLEGRFSKRTWQRIKKERTATMSKTLQIASALKVDYRTLLMNKEDV